MATAASIKAAIAEGIRKKPTDWLVTGAKDKVLAPYGSLIARYCRPIPDGLVGVRIYHETRGNPSRRSREDERGLLQIYPWLRQRCGISSTEAYDPAKNIACGCPDWIRRGNALRAKYPQVARLTGNDFWGLSNLTMSIGSGATGKLIQTTGGGFYAIWNYVNRDPAEFAKTPYWWYCNKARTRCQRHELVAKRIAGTYQFLAAADKVAGVAGGALLLAAIGVGIYLYLKR